MQIAYIPEELLRQLLYIRKCYHARYPTNLTALTLPSPDLMSNWDVQTWLVHHLLEEESVHLARYKRSLSVAGNEKSSSSTQHMLGAVRWRRAFHKRLVQHIEHGLSITADTDGEVHERLLENVVELMSISDTEQNNTTCLRRFYYTLQSEEQYIVTREADAPVSGGTTGLRTWQAGIRMANHLLAHPDIVASKKVLEMGSGTGVLACLIDKIQVSRTDKTRRGGLIATDTDGNNGVLQALRDNLALNSCDEVIVIPLDWTKPVTDSRFVDIDVVVATDVVYDPSIVPDFVRCLSGILHQASRDGVVAYISTTMRTESTFELFLTESESARLSVSELSFAEAPAGTGLVGGDEPTSRVRLFEIEPAG